MRAVLAAVLLATLAGCGGASQAEAPMSLPLLPADAVPGLEATTKPVGLEELLGDLGAVTANSELEISGFASGRERVFQGESAQFDRVVSRTLEFDDADAAAAYVQLLRDHAADLYGTGTNAEDIESDGRSGVLIDAASCACHRAEPTLAAAVSEGPRVSYLEVNGGGAKRAAVEELLAKAP